MFVHCQAASTVLDMLWEDLEVRREFSELGADLNDLGPLTHEVFVPAFLHFKANLDPSALGMLDAQVTEELLEPHYDSPNFREAWDGWNDDTRNGFLREQTEVKLAQLLMRFYADEFFNAYKAAFVNYLNNNPQRAAKG